MDLVLERLAQQKRLAEYGAQEGGGGGGSDDDEGQEEPFLFSANLRDDVLRSVHSFRERERIWGRVWNVVQQNSNVRAAMREGRSGDVGRAWEWIGALPAPAAYGYRRRRRSERASSSRGAGADVKREDSAAPVKVEDGAGGDHRGPPHQHRRWENSRPIY